MLLLQLRVVADESCAPELRPEALEQIAGNMASSIGGWMKQQLIKLACSFTIKASCWQLATLGPLISVRYLLSGSRLKKQMNKLACTFIVNVRPR